MLREGCTVFDVLACLCALLNVEEERECAIQWATASKENIKAVIDKYHKFEDIILRASINDGYFTEIEFRYLYKELQRLQQQKDERKNDIFRLAIAVEHRIEKYSKWQSENVLHEVKALNTNADLTGVLIYPRANPRWEQKKSERNREFIWNTCFENFMLIRKCDAAPFEFVIHYWNDNGILKSTETGWVTSVALAPVMDGAVLNVHSEDTDSGKVICVDGIENGDAVSERVLQVFDEMFERQHSIIVFPETLGTQELVMKVKAKMRVHPEYCVFVLLPTICENDENKLVVLGPGGVECLVQNKVTPFILTDKDDVRQREKLKYGGQVHLLITEELGLVAFPICADLLDPQYYHAITSVARADTIICPSFSPGSNAFKDTMSKGKVLKLLELYVNTCSAKTSSRSGAFEGEVAMALLPMVKSGDSLHIFKRECAGECASTMCYFDLTISYSGGIFFVESVHRCA